MNSLNLADVTKEVNALRKLLGQGWESKIHTHHCQNDAGRKFNEYYPKIQKGSILLSWYVFSYEKVTRSYKATIEGLGNFGETRLPVGEGKTYLEAFQDLSKNCEKFISDLVSKMNKTVDEITYAKTIYLEEISRAEQKQ